MSAEFKPALGPFSATMVVVGGIIGAGIFITPSVVAQRLESVPLFLAAWAVGGAIALAGALAYAELGALFPQAGGQYVYLRETYHPLIAFLYGWAELLLIKGGALAAIAITFGEYLLRAAPLLAGGAAARAWGVAAILLVSGINWFGVRPGSRVLNLFVILKVAALAALIAAGLAAAGPAGPWIRALPGSAARGSLADFGAALVPVLFAYGGWQSVNWVAAEVRDPRRILPRALLLGTALVVLIYITINIAYLRALGLAGLAATPTPAAGAARWLFGAPGERFIAWAIAIST
ncbi:MAG TPA: amino acid permease, partial [Thermoanaerobaculia bacterium]|nr:amino acid permease [Thermoanaerobaculia bacterium]